MATTRRSFLQFASAAALATRLAPAAVAATVARQPYIQRLLATSASILWTTTQPGSGVVVVFDNAGKATSVSASMLAFPGSVTGLSAPYYQYQADIAGLVAGGTYSYQVSVDGQMLASDPTQFTFTTPTPGKFSFLVFGDSGNDSPEQRSLVQQMLGEPNISKVIHVGDMAYMNGTFAQFEANYFGVNAPLMSKLPFFATPGNHEYETSNAAAFVAGHSMPASGVPMPDIGRYYSFDWGDTHFTSIDSNLLGTNAQNRMLAWLENDLASSPKYWKIVFLHHPPYPTGEHLGDPLCALVQQNVNPIVERHGVQLVLSGHEHGYERSWPLLGGQRVQSGQSTTYVITGGGGGAMESIGSLPQCALSINAFHYLRVDVDSNQLTFSAIAKGGGVIDKVTLTPPPALGSNAVLSIGDFTPAVSSGSLATIFGQNLAARPASCTGTSLSNQLGGISVKANGIPVPLLYVSPGQINVQIPYEVSGQVTFQIATPNGLVSTTTQVMPLAPSIIAIEVGDAACSKGNPAAQGHNVTMYATGLGVATSPVPTGQSGPPEANSMAASFQVWVGNTPLQPSYAGIAPGFAGLSQINFAIPGAIPDGVYPIRLASGSASSQPQNLFVGLTSGL